MVILRRKKSDTYHKTFYYQKGKKSSYKRETGEQKRKKLG